MGHTVDTEKKSTMTTTATTATRAATRAATQPTLTPQQKRDILEYIKELTDHGHHLEASIMYTEYFGLV